jgi:hypothetical protein
MTSNSKTFLLVLPGLFFLNPIWAAEFTHKEFAKASDPWRPGFVFGIAGTCPLWRSLMKSLLTR